MNEDKALSSHFHNLAHHGAMISVHHLLHSSVRSTERMFRCEEREQYVQWMVGETLGGLTALLSHRMRLGLLYLHGREIC